MQLFLYDNTGFTQNFSTTDTTSLACPKCPLGSEAFKSFNRSTYVSVVPMHVADTRFWKHIGMTFAGSCSSRWKYICSYLHVFLLLFFISFSPDNHITFVHWCPLSIDLYCLRSRLLYISGGFVQIGCTLVYFSAK